MAQTYNPSTLGDLGKKIPSSSPYGQLVQSSFKNKKEWDAAQILILEPYKQRKKKPQAFEKFSIKNLPKQQQKHLNRITSLKANMRGKVAVVVENLKLSYSLSNTVHTVTISNCMP